MTDELSPRSAEQIAVALMSAYRHDQPATMELHPSDHAGIVKLYQQEKSLQHLREWMQQNPAAKEDFTRFAAQKKKQGG